jgi:hypothetical protein
MILISCATVTQIKPAQIGLLRIDKSLKNYLRKIAQMAIYAIAHIFCGSNI